jgi:hypothetical protein
LQFDSIKRRSAERQILRANLRDVVEHLTVPLEPSMRFNRTFGIAANADANISGYAPAS